MVEIKSFMKKPKHKKIQINDYMQHWLYSTPTGHILRIVDGKDNTWEIVLNWKTYRRTRDVKFLTGSN